MRPKHYAHKQNIRVVMKNYYDEKCLGFIQDEILRKLLDETTVTTDNFPGVVHK